MRKKKNSQFKEMPLKRIDIPYEPQQEELGVEIKCWVGNNGDNRYDLILRTKHSAVHHSLSREHMRMLIEKCHSFQY
jgi:hypothetical protein|tara:strand:- start:329 stop:559 length:231 start_codon:yes stop_codon:yes gene_type:complete